MVMTGEEHIGPDIRSKTPNQDISIKDINLSS